MTANIYAQPNEGLKHDDVTVVDNFIYDTDDDIVGDCDVTLVDNDVYT